MYKLVNGPFTYHYFEINNLFAILTQGQSYRIIPLITTLHISFLNLCISHGKA